MFWLLLPDVSSVRNTGQGLSLGRPGSALSFCIPSRDEGDARTERAGCGLVAICH